MIARQRANEKERGRQEGMEERECVCASRMQLFSLKNNKMKHQRTASGRCLKVRKTSFRNLCRGREVKMRVV